VRGIKINKQKNKQTNKHKASLTPPLFMEVLVPNQESERC